MPSPTDDDLIEEESARSAVVELELDRAAVTQPEPSQMRTPAIDAAHAAIARATARELDIHAAYDRARNVLRARSRRRALVGPTRERFSSAETTDAYAGGSLPSLAWGLPVSRCGHLLAVISPTAGAITPQIRRALAPHPIVVASFLEEERLRKVCEPRQRFVVLSVPVSEPTHEAIVDYARRNPNSPRRGTPLIQRPPR